MASRTTLVALFAFSAAFWGLQLLVDLGTPGETRASQPQRQSCLARLAGAALLPAVLAAFALSLILVFAHVRALGRANAAAARGGGVSASGRLADAALLAAVAALLAGAVLRLDDAGFLGLGGAYDVGWWWLTLNTE